MKHFERIENGRLVRKGEKRTAQKIDPYWSNGRQTFLITTMTHDHLINSIKKLQEGSTSHRSVFRHGKKHPQYKQLVLEAARRGLCLKFKSPQLGGVQKAVKKLRTVGRGLPAATRRLNKPTVPTEAEANDGPATTVIDDDKTMAKVLEEALGIDPDIEIDKEELEALMMADDL